jgi:hypothetical protein
MPHITTVQYDIIVFTCDDMLATLIWFGSLALAHFEAVQDSVVTGQM